MGQIFSQEKETTSRGPRDDTDEQSSELGILHEFRKKIFRYK